MLSIWLYHVQVHMIEDEMKGNSRGKFGHRRGKFCLELIYKAWKTKKI